MVVVLMVAEKPSIAKSIADVLSNGHASSWDTRLPVLEFTGSFLGKAATFRVTSVAGHLFSTDFPTEYQSWDLTDPATLFTANVEKSENSRGVTAHLRDCARGASYVVLWLDCDREGENICFEVIDVISGKLERVPGQQIFRAHFSAIAKPDIEKAMRTLTAPNENESLAVDARQELDLKVGVAFSRFQTRFFQGRYANLDSSVISYGPCQTPTLGFCVDRHDEILNFTPEPFWVVEVELGKDGRTVCLEWDRGRLFDHETACLFETIVKEGSHATVTSVMESETTRPRPTALNTVEMLKIASRALGMGPAQAMSAAERLYLSGYLSYPRTESTQYPDSFDLEGTVSEQCRSPCWGSYAATLLAAGLQRPKKGVDAGDHPPITPVRSAAPGELVGDMERLYDMITRHFLATVSADAIYAATKATFEINGEAFSVSGKRMIVPGFTEVMTLFTKDDVILPIFTKGERMIPERVYLREGRTSPPGFLTEAELIEKMEKYGIGTDASIPTHINNICLRNYVEIGAGRVLKPTQLGIVLVHGYHRIDPDLVMPKVRAAIERECNMIAAGKARKETVLQHALEIFQQKFVYFVSKVAFMDTLFQAVFDPLAATGKPLSRCGKCRRFMRYIPLKPQRLYCPTCNETYNLPQNGTIKLYKELKCPLDNFELILFSLGNSASALGKSYTLCPCCYNSPPFEGLVHMGCNSCLNVSCVYSVVQNGVCPCPGGGNVMIPDRPGTGRPSTRGGGGYRGRGTRGREPTGVAAGAGSHRESDEEGEDSTCTGVIVLDRDSRPTWKMACNVCDLIVRFTADLHDVKTLPDEKCADCGATILCVDFHKDKTPLPAGETKYQGCVLCDDLLNSFTELKHSRTKHIALIKRRGRGRGRARRKPIDDC